MTTLVLYAYCPGTDVIETAQTNTMQGMDKAEIPNVKVGRFLVENSWNEKNCYQNTWSSGFSHSAGSKVSTNDKLSRPALGRSASFHSHSSKTSGLAQLPNKLQIEERIEQETPLRTLWENPNQQVPKPTMKKEESVHCEDSGYLSTFGGMSSDQRHYLSGTFTPNKWVQDENMTFNRNGQDLDDTDSIYTDDGAMSLLRRTQIKASLLRSLNGVEENVYQAVDEKTKTMNKKKRIVRKDGMMNISFKNISKKKRRFFSDLYTTLLDASWTFSVIMFFTSFYGSWFFFGGIYFIICYLHGDFMEEKDWIPCILQVDGFASSFLFSLETQHTIGYGSRQITTECPLAMMVVSLQAVIGCIIQAFMVGLIFSKLSRPRNRSRTIIFSNQAVVAQRNGRLCLIMRIGDLRDDNFVLGTQVSLKMIRRKISQEGEIYQDMENLKVTPDTSSESCLFFVWPLDIVHVIDEDSPFYDMSAADLARERFELILMMEGTNETSNMTFQARTSYLPQEILWGHRFEQLVIYRRDQHKFQVNFSAFHSTYEVSTSLCAARNLESARNGKQLNLKTPMIPRSQSSLMLPNLSRHAFGDNSSVINRTYDNGCLSPVSISRANSNSMRKTSQGMHASDIGQSKTDIQ